MTSRERLASARLYVITDATPALAPIEAFVEAAVRGGAGMLQLRDRSLDDRALLVAVRRFAGACRRVGAPLIVNDRLDVALAGGADGVHVGQDDMPPVDVRGVAGPDFIIGLSTHTAAQIDAANGEPIDYIGAGPIYATPTKPGRPAVGVALVRYAALHARPPWFAIGGLDPTTIGAVAAAGASRVCVLRWVAQAADPEEAAREAIRALDDPASARYGSSPRAPSAGR